MGFSEYEYKQLHVTKWVAIVLITFANIYVQLLLKCLIYLTNII